MDYTLLEKQTAFALFISKMIVWAYNEGYEVTFGEAWRSDETAKLDAQEGKGIDNSLHRLRLAEDLNLFKDGKFLTATEDYKPLGEYWEAHSVPGLSCTWGGRFTKPDSDHFSIEHNGVR